VDAIDAETAITTAARVMDLNMVVPFMCPIGAVCFGLTYFVRLGR
jgi:hypothetical protein